MQAFKNGAQIGGNYRIGLFDSHGAITFKDEISWAAIRDKSNILININQATLHFMGPLSGKGLVLDATAERCTLPPFVVRDYPCE